MYFFNIYLIYLLMICQIFNYVNLNLYADYISLIIFTKYNDILVHYAESH